MLEYTCMSWYRWPCTYIASYCVRTQALPYLSVRGGFSILLFYSDYIMCWQTKANYLNKWRHSDWYSDIVNSSPSIDTCCQPYNSVVMCALLVRAWSRVVGKISSSVLHKTASACCSANSHSSPENHCSLITHVYKLRWVGDNRRGTYIFM